MAKNLFTEVFCDQHYNSRLPQLQPLAHLKLAAAYDRALQEVAPQFGKYHTLALMEPKLDPRNFSSREAFHRACQAQRSWQTKMKRTATAKTIEYFEMWASAIYKRDHSNSIGKYMINNDGYPSEQKWGDVDEFRRHLKLWFKRNHIERVLFGYGSGIEVTEYL